MHLYWDQSTFFKKFKNYKITITLFLQKLTSKRRFLDAGFVMHCSLKEGYKNPFLTVLIKLNELSTDTSPLNSSPSNTNEPTKIFPNITFTLDEIFFLF